MKKLAVFLTLILLISCNQNKKTAEHQLGVVHLDVTGNEEARTHFEKGLLLLHSFEYTDAREAFEAAEKAAPSLAMAYWGQAMTQNHSIWFEQDYEKAAAILHRMKKNAQLSELTPLESDLIRAVEILYETDQPKNQRDQAYADYLKVLHNKYPDNQEIAAFYSLSLLGTVSEGRDYEVYGEAARIAKKIIKVNPKHPGALHYLIHSYDDPEHAQLALDAADAYAVVAPDAAHALHMPSHIYVAMGMWDKVVASNEDSYGASINRMNRKALGNDARGYHSYHWLQYGYLQQGRQQDAEKMTLKLQDYIKETPSKRGRSHLVFLKGTYLSETDHWDSPIANIPVAVSDLNVVIRAQYAFTRGMQAFIAKTPEELHTTIIDLEQDLARESVKIDNQEQGFASCANLTRETATRTDLKLAEVMVLQMKGLYAWLESDGETTENYLTQAVDLENQLTYSYGPPVVQKPTQELYADWLMTQERTAEALDAYKRTLKRAPKRSKALQGVLKASEILDNRQLALETKALLEQQSQRDQSLNIAL